MNERCDQCKFYTPKQTPDGKDKEYGTCYGLPPILESIRFIRPQVEWNDKACSLFKPKP